MKILDTKFDFDKETGTTFCTIICKDNLVFMDAARCHEDDMDMYSQRTGAEIAHRRAWIKMLQHIRDNELQPVVNAYRHLYDILSQSKNFNAKSHETRMVRRQLCMTENDLARIKQELAYERKSLKDYIAGKEKLWNKIRAKNKGEINQSEPSEIQ